MQPRDEAEFADMLWTIVHHDGPAAIRYPRGTGTGAIPAKKPKLLEIGKSEVIRHGTKAAIFALGNMCELAIPAAEELEKQGISTAVINARWIKPLDTATLEFFAGGCDVICTMEDHVLANGFGASVVEHLSDRHITTPVVRIGWPDQFVEHGTVPILRAKHGLTIEATIQKILTVIGPSTQASSTSTSAA
jgi:1-deoxy-D-xylulose-5-phosphate synthase